MAATSKRRRYRRFNPALAGSQLLLLIAAGITLAPLVWMLGISLTAPNDIGSAALRPLPANPTLQNYARALEASNIPLQFGNSLIFAGGVTLGLLAISVPAAYALSKWQFRGAKLFLAAMILGLSIPFVVTYLPNFLFVTRAGLMNTYPGLILPHIANTYGVLLLTQHFRSFPVSILEAAQLDGATPRRTLVQVLLPTMIAPITSIGLFIFISTWNELVWPQLVAPNKYMQVLSTGLTQFASLEGGVSYGPLMAAGTLTALPTLVLFFLFRRRILAVSLQGGVG